MLLVLVFPIAGEWVHCWGFLFLINGVKLRKSYFYICNSPLRGSLILLLLKQKEKTGILQMNPVYHTLAGF